MRIDKMLADSGHGSRRDVKKLLRTGGVTVNGAVCTDPGFSVVPGTDTVAVNGAEAAVRVHTYLMMNKPSGVISSTSDPSSRTVIDILPPQFRLKRRGVSLFPAGRLDKDAEGLLLLTDDGVLAHRLASPKTGTDKTYFVLLRDPVSPDCAERFAAGIFIAAEGKERAHTCLPAVLGVPECGGSGAYAAVVTIREGKFHQVKRMFRAAGNEVLYLKRTRIGPLELDVSLAPGDVRELTEKELFLLKKTAGQE